MPYSQSQSVAEVRDRFGLQQDPTLDLSDIPPLEPSRTLREILAQKMPLALGSATEKARSEFLIAPLLGEVWVRTNRRVAVFSGAEFNVEAEAGLAGACDSIITRSLDFPAITSPVLLVVEAKRDDLDRGAGQCAAELVAAQRFNAAHENPNLPIWGAVTTGTVWRFLRLAGTLLALEYRDHSLENLDRLLGIRTAIVA